VKKTRITSLEVLIPLLPKQSYSMTKKPMEPVNVIILGGLRQIQKTLFSHGWVKAHPIGLVSLARASWATVLNRGYPNGPMSPSYIGKKHFLMGFEHVTTANSFRRRHHMRLWKTNYKLGKNRVWVATISYDRAPGFDTTGIIPTHHIAPTLAWEENFLARSLGLQSPQFVKISQPKKGKLSNGDPYSYDGKALVLNLTK
jgi:hypothetical protein